MSTPRWQPLAEAMYALLLQLYPRRIRERHGEEMQQVFRDRCREVAEGRVSAFRLLGLEMTTDFAGSIAAAHFEEALMPKARKAVVALALLACAWLFQAPISKAFLDAWFTASLHYQHWSDERALRKDEAKVRALARQLASIPDAMQRSLAAQLLAMNVAGRRYRESSVIGTPATIQFDPAGDDAAQASRLLASLAQTSDVAAARLSLETCAMLPGCDRLAYAQALVRLEPLNAYAWSKLFKLHSVAGDEGAVRADLRQLGASRYYDDGIREAALALWSATMRSTPGDTAAFGALGRQWMGPDAFADDYYEYDLMARCSKSWPSHRSNSPRMVGLDLSSQPECRQVAVLLAGSSDVFASRWGWHWLDHAQSSPRTQAGARAAEARVQKLGTVGGTIDKDTHYWRAWTDAEWMAWAKAKHPAR